MNITLFGASGKTGQIILNKALSRGHKVTAYVRRADSISISDPKLNIVVGNLNETSKLEQVIKEADVCISALGGSSLKKPSVDFTEGIKNVVGLMELHPVKQFIYISSIGVGDSRYYMSRPVRFIVADILLRIPFSDHAKNEKSITESNISWTIIRPGGLTENSQAETIKYGTEKIRLKGNLKISRSNVAEFILNQLLLPDSMNKAFWLYE